MLSKLKHLNLELGTSTRIVGIIRHDNIRFTPLTHGTLVVIFDTPVNWKFLRFAIPIRAVFESDRDKKDLPHPWVLHIDDVEILNPLQSAAIWSAVCKLEQENA